MTDADFETIRACTVEVLQVAPERVVPGADLVKDLRAKSLDLVELSSAIEEAFGIAIPDEEFIGVATIEDVCNLVRRRRS